VTESKESREIVAELRRQGWNVERTERGHYKARPPDAGKPMVTFAGGLSGDHRSVKNAVAQLRRSGFVWPPTKTNGVTFPFLPPPEGRLADGTVVREGDTILANGAVIREHPVPVKLASCPELELEPEPPTPDELYAELRAARDDHRLHAELLAEADAALLRAAERTREAKEDLQRCAERLRDAKAAFDAAFEAEGS
jgi:hypothetical protein